MTSPERTVEEVVRLCIERAEGYGGLRRSLLTPVTLDCADLLTTQAARIAELEIDRETLFYLAKWVERGIYDPAISPRDALGVMAVHPGMPFNRMRWDVDHKAYAGSFYRDHPKALLQDQPR